MNPLESVKVQCNLFWMTVERLKRSRVGGLGSFKANPQTCLLIEIIDHLRSLAERGPPRTDNVFSVCCCVLDIKKDGLLPSLTKIPEDAPP